VKEPRWKHRVAAAYRWTFFELGQPMPPELLENDPRVVDLVRRYEARWRPDNLARAELEAKVVRGSQSPEALAYVALCVAQVKANMAQLLARNRAAMMSAQQEREALHRVQRVLGLSAKETPDVDQ
jgi:hypothetical protein